MQHRKKTSQNILGHFRCTNPSNNITIYHLCNRKRKRHKTFSEIFVAPTPQITLQCTISFFLYTFHDILRDFLWHKLLKQHCNAPFPSFLNTFHYILRDVLWHQLLNLHCNAPFPSFLHTFQDWRHERETSEWDIYTELGRIIITLMACLITPGSFIDRTVWALNM